ncbi:DNA polymerase III subunit gamma/tau, partial [bacterium]|nr:DNA polymerase III subunit gamma/tau [bacterium]
MSYLVLARKYRPQTFEDIVGQQHVTRTLSAAITQDRVAHAYLFTGTRGVGKTTIARILAKALNCESSDGPTPTPCNACRACTEITRGNFVDVIEIDGASNNSVDDVRQLRESVKYRPQSARKKIIIIDEVHMLSIAAFNALLKTLEEPPDHVVFIFATTEVHKVPDTILSRVQQYDFKSIPLALIFDALADIAKKESLSLSEDALRLVSRKAEGSMRDALSLLDQIIALGGDLSASELAEVLGLVDRQLLLRLSAAVLSEDTEAALAVLRDMGPVAWDVRAFYGDLMEHFRNLVIAKLAKDPAPLINATAEELAQISGQAAGAGIETLENLFGILIEAEEEVMRSSQQRLVLEMTILRLLAAGRVQSLDSLAQAVG